METLRIVPVDPAERGEFDVIDGPPRPLLRTTNQFGFVQAVHALDESVVETEERAEQTKSEFIAVIGHELRTPLTLIKGFARTLLKRHNELPPETMHQSLLSVDEQANHLEQLIEDMLFLTEAERSGTRLYPEWQDLVVAVRDFVSEAADRQSEESSPRDIVVRSETMEIPMMLDRAKTVRILAHLLDNALKFSDDRVIFELSRRDDYALVSVVDTGVGIYSGNLDTIFDRFHQIDGTSTRESGGTGIGLYICRRRCELRCGSTAHAAIRRATVDILVGRSLIHRDYSLSPVGNRFTKPRGFEDGHVRAETHDEAHQECLGGGRDDDFGPAVVVSNDVFYRVTRRHPSGARFQQKARLDIIGRRLIAESESRGMAGFENLIGNVGGANPVDTERPVAPRRPTMRRQVPVAVGDEYANRLHVALRYDIASVRPVVEMHKTSRFDGAP